MKPVIVLSLVCGGVAFGPGALADTSTFDANSEGWQVVSFGNLSTDNFNVVGTYAPSYHATGGNPGGYISTDDPDGGDFTFSAPATFLGARPGATGGTLSYDLSNNAVVDYQVADVILTGGSMVNRLLYLPQTAFVPTSSFQTVNVALAAVAGWHVDASNGPMPTEAQFQDMLANLNGVFIRGEYHDGGETAGLDNVNLSIVPAPSALGILGAGTLFAGASRRRRI